MPTLRPRSVVNSSSGTPPPPAAASTSPRSHNKKTNNTKKKASPPSRRLVSHTAVTARSLDPVTPAGDREHALSSASSLVRRQTRAGARARKEQGPGKKLLFGEQEDHHHNNNEAAADEAETLVGNRRSSKRIRRGRGAGGGREVAVLVSVTEVEAKESVVNTAAAPKMSDGRAMADKDKGKRKVVDLGSDSDEEEEPVVTDSDEDFQLKGIDYDFSFSAKAGNGIGANGRSHTSRGERRSKRNVNVGVRIDTAFEEDLNRALQPPELSSGPPQDFVLDPNESSRRAEATKAKFLEIARRRAAHFAHFAGGEEDEKPAGPSTAVNADTERFVDEQKKRAADLLAGVSANAGRPDNDREDGQWHGPFVIARQLVEGRAAATAARSESTRESGPKAESSVQWTPSRKPTFRNNKVATTLHDMCVEVLCNNIEHVQSLVGVPDAAKKLIAARLCAQRVMTPGALRLYFLSEPAEVIVPDCTFVTEETLTEALAKCSTQRLEVLELGLCGRAMSDQLITATLAGLGCSLPILHTLVLNGAYRLTDTGLRAFLRVAPNLTTLNLKQCNMISADGLEAVASSIGRTLKVFSLEQCSQLNALKVLPPLLNLSNLESVALSGLSGMSDGIISELAVILGARLLELSISDCRALTDDAIGAISLCCSGLKLLDIGHLPLLTDKAIGCLADGCRSLRTLRLDRGKFSDTTLAALITASGNYLTELSLNSVRLAGDLTICALAKYSKETLEVLDMSFCREVNDQGLGLLADSCEHLHELRLFGCTQVTRLFLIGHSNPGLDVIGLPNSVLDVTSLGLKPSRKAVLS